MLCKRFGIIVIAHVPLVAFNFIYIYLVSTRMPGESYCRLLRSLLLCSCVKSFKR